MFIILALLSTLAFSQVLRPCIAPTPLSIDLDHSGHGHPTGAPTPMPPCLSTTDTGTIMVETSFDTMTSLETTLPTTKTTPLTTTTPTTTPLTTTLVATINSVSSWNIDKILPVLAIAVIF